MDNDTAEELQSAVRKAAEIVERQWPGVIDAADAEQEIWRKLLESPGSVNKVLGMNQSARVKSLIRVGSQVGAEYRNDYEAFTGNILYGTKDVRAILKRGVLTDLKYRTDSERMDLEEGLASLREANPRYAEAIGTEYLLDEPLKDRKLIQRAVDALTVRMNRVNELRRNSYDNGPGSRKAMSNSAAGFASSNNY